MKVFNYIRFKVSFDSVRLTALQIVLLKFYGEFNNISNNTETNNV